MPRPVDTGPDRDDDAPRRWQLLAGTVWIDPRLYMLCDPGEEADPAAGATARAVHAEARRLERLDLPLADRIERLEAFLADQGELDAALAQVDA